MYHALPDRRAALRRIGSLGLGAALSSCAGRRPSAPHAVYKGPDPVLARAAQHDLVSIAEADPTIVIDLRYTTPRNFTGRPVYPVGMPCLVHARTAAMLCSAQEIIRRQGCRLRIWDAWRPPEAAQILYDRAGDTGYVHKPGADGRWSWHCYGRAVDVTLSDPVGRPLRMPTDFDDFTDAARAEYTGSDFTVRRHLDILQGAMEASGFENLILEWWHFNDNPGAIPPAPVFGRDLGLAFG